MTGPALAIMARQPVPGQVKTRLCPFLTPEQCADLYSAFIKDDLALATSASSYTVFLAFTPIEAKSFFRTVAPPSVTLVAQGHGDLGQKMYRVCATLCRQGYSPVIIIGSDLPTLQPRHLQQALEALRDHDVCLGPTPDGGYYLVGQRQANQRLFDNIPWSTPLVLPTTLARAKDAGLSLALLDSCSDVDTVEDLHRLSVDVGRLRQTPGSVIPRNTEACLRRLLPHSV